MTKTTRRGAPKRGEPTARERLVATATELFYQQGIRAIGIDAVIERSGVSKSTLYRTFASKDELIAAFAEEQSQRYWQWWDSVVAAHPDLPQRQIEALFSALADLVASPSFRGCPFINLTIEFPDSKHPGTVIACANKEEARRRLRLLARGLGIQDPDRLGDQLALVMEGAYGYAVTLGVGDLKSRLVELAQMLTKAHVMAQRGDERP